MPVEFDRSNWVVELGGNPLRLHCMPAWSKCLLQALDAGQIRLVKLGANPLRLHCMPAWSKCLLKALDASRIRLVELGGQIGWKSIEITLYACLVEMPVKGFRCRSNWVEIH